MADKSESILVIGGELGFNHFLWAFHRRDEELLRQIGENLQDYGVMFWKTTDEGPLERREVSIKLADRLDEIVAVVITKPKEELSSDEMKFIQEAERNSVITFFSSKLFGEEAV